MNPGFLAQREMGEGIMNEDRLTKWKRGGEGVDERKRVRRGMITASESGVKGAGCGEAVNNGGEG
jgi:hypothetical protein